MPKSNKNMSKVKTDSAYLHFFTLFFAVITNPDVRKRFVSNTCPMEPLLLAKDILAFDHLSLWETPTIAVSWFCSVVEPLFVILGTFKLLYQFSIKFELLFLQSVLTLVPLLVCNVCVFSQFSFQSGQLNLQFLSRLRDKLVELLWNFDFLKCHPIA